MKLLKSVVGVYIAVSLAVSIAGYLFGAGGFDHYGVTGGDDPVGFLLASFCLSVLTIWFVRKWRKDGVWTAIGVISFAALVLLPVTFFSRYATGIYDIRYSDGTYGQPNAFITMAEFIYGVFFAGLVFTFVCWKICSFFKRWSEKTAAG